jgi:hypothetical protein
VAPPPSWEEQFDADHDDEVPVRYRMVEDVLGEPGSNPGLASRTLSEDLLLAEDVEPSTYEQAQAHECWRLAMLDELTSIEANGTWELVDPPQMQWPIGLKWVYKTKRDASGVITKHKARLVAKGYVQKQGVDFEEVFCTRCMPGISPPSSMVSSRRRFMSRSHPVLLNQASKEKYFG